MERHDWQALRPAFNENARYLLQLCFSNRLCIKKYLFPAQKCLQVHLVQTWYSAEVLDRLLHCFIRLVVRGLGCASETIGQIDN